VDIGKYGTNSDDGILQDSAFGLDWARNTINVPRPAELVNAPELGQMLHVIIGDQHFL